MRVVSERTPAGAEVIRDAPGVPTLGARRHLGLVRLASWNIIDQVLSALTNAVLSIVVARTVGKEQFGAFAACFLVFSVCIGIERALVGQPMGIRYSSQTGPTLASGVSRALGTALTVALVGAVGCIGAGLLLGGHIGPTLVATGSVLPALLLQDACRMIFFARSKANLAAANDALWAVIQFTVIWLLIGLGTVTTPRLVLTWGGAAAVCVVVALVQLRVVPRPFGARSWIEEHKDLSGYLLAEYLLGAGAFQGGILIVGALAGGNPGLAIIGAFRAAQVVLGPLGILATALQTFSLPELSKRTWLVAAARWKVALLIGGIMAGTSLAYTAVLMLLPLAAGRFLFRDSWLGAREVLLPLALGSSAGGLCLGAAIVIYSLGLARRTFRIMTVEAPLVFTLMIVGSKVGGAQGAAWGLCIDQVVLIPLWFWTLSEILRDRRIAERDAERQVAPGQVIQSPMIQQAPAGHEIPGPAQVRTISLEASGAGAEPAGLDRFGEGSRS